MHTARRLDLCVCVEYAYQFVILRRRNVMKRVRAAIRDTVCPKLNGQIHTHKNDTDKKTTTSHAQTHTKTLKCRKCRQRDIECNKTHEYEYACYNTHERTRARGGVVLRKQNKTQNARHQTYGPRAHAGRKHNAAASNHHHIHIHT